MSDEVIYWSDSPDGPAPRDLHLSAQLGVGQGSEEGGAPLPGIDMTIATPYVPEPGAEPDSPLRGRPPGDDQMPVGPVVVGTGPSGAAGAAGVAGAAGGPGGYGWPKPAPDLVVSLAYEWNDRLLPTSPNPDCQTGDFVTFTPRSNTMQVKVYNGQTEVKSWEQMSVEAVKANKDHYKYEGCYTHWRATGRVGIDTYAVAGRYNGVAYDKE